MSVAMQVYLVTFGILVFFTIVSHLAESKRFSERVTNELELLSLFSFFWLLLAIAASLVMLIWTHTDEILRGISTVWFGVFIALAVIPLFWFRERWLFAYGAIEIVVSFVMIGLAVSAPLEGKQTAAATTVVVVGHPLLAKFTALFTAAYVSVRGLVNMDADVPKRLTAVWEKWMRWPRKYKPKKE